MVVEVVCLMDMKIDEILQIKPMKYLARINIMCLLFYSLASVAQVRSLVNPNSTLTCMQGVWQPVNSTNDGLIEYIVYDSFKSISISYKREGGLENIMLTINGFYNFTNGYSLKDSLKVADLKYDGQYFVWFFEEDLNTNGWAILGGVQKGLICSGEMIEMTNNSMTMLEKTYIPYTVYKYLRELEKKDKRDYISEFDILNKLKMAKVSIEKAYFYNDTDEKTKRKAFVIKNDSLIVDSIFESWVKVAYEGKGTTTLGWIKRSAVDILD